MDLTEVADKKIENLIVAITRLETTLADYIPITKLVYSNEKRISMQEKRCNYVQQNKTRVNWGTVLTSLISMIIGAIIVYFMSGGKI